MLTYGEKIFLGQCVQHDKITVCLVISNQLHNLVVFLETLAPTLPTMQHDHQQRFIVCVCYNSYLVQGYIGPIIFLAPHPQIMSTFNLCSTNGCFTEVTSLEGVSDFTKI